MARPVKAQKNCDGANLGFEASLWQAATDPIAAVADGHHRRVAVAVIGRVVGGTP